MHPSLTELKAYLQQGKPEQVGLHIESCERCQTTLAGIENLAEVSKSHDLDVDSIIEDSSKRVRSKISTRQQAKYTFLRYAAAILFILGSSWLLYDYSSEQPLLETELAMTYKAPPLLRSSEQSNWNDFQQHYSAKRFGKAFEQLAQFEPKTGQTEFYKGLCKLYLQNPDYAKAVEYFESALVTKSRYAEQANYYTALSYLKIEEVEKAKKILKRISESDNHYKQKEAAELLVSY